MSIDCNKEANHTVKYTYLLRLFCTYTFFIAILLSILACKTNQHSDPPKLLVGTASSLEYLFEDLVDDFESENNVEVILVIGSSGSLAQQISAGAPLDVFVSANRSMSSRIKKSALLNNEIHTFAYGKLALVSNLNFKVGTTWDTAISDKRIEYISIPNPELAPYGTKALEVLRGADNYNELANRIVFSSNVASSLEFVKSGNAQAGFISLSQFYSELTNELSIWEIKKCTQAELEQTILINNASSYPALSQSFVDYVMSDASSKIIESFGYTKETNKSKELDNCGQN